LNYTETKTTNTNQQWENLKGVMTTAAKKDIREIKATT
jgi:hypothetical protein